MIGSLLGVLFGGGPNALRETVEVFRPNAEASAIRDAVRAQAALGQFAAEFTAPRRGWFDRFIDGLNRLPRPMLALGTIGLFSAAMAEPVWFAARMQGVTLIPEPLWWLMGVIVSFYFGARYQMKSQEFQRSMAYTLTRTSEVARRIEAQDGLNGSDPEAGEGEANAALEDWRRARER